MPRRARTIEDIVYRPLAAIGGSVSAEHGIGLEKRAYLPLSRTPAEISTMRLLKQALDPKGILNPGQGIRMRQPAHLDRAEREVTVAAMQFACGWDVERNIATAERLVRQAAKQGAQIILIQELFETPYFCIEQDSRHLRVGHQRGRQSRHQAFRADRARARTWCCRSASSRRRTTPSSIRSRSSMPTARNLGVYRKAHIPNGPGYQEKNYFSPGDTGFKVWDTNFARIGVGICWDQWFPECARAMALMGAELLFYPTAIGSEPPPALPVNSRDHWQRTQQGHAAANLTPLIASNRIGTERALQDPDKRLHPLLWIELHRRLHRREGRRGRRGERGRDHREVRSRRERGTAQQLVRVPRPAAGPVRRANYLRWTG